MQTKLMCILLILVMFFAGIFSQPMYVYAQQCQSCKEVNVYAQECKNQSSEAIEEVKITEFQLEDDSGITIAYLPEKVNITNIDFQIKNLDEISDTTSHNYYQAENEIVIIMDDDGVYDVIAPTCVTTTTIIIGVLVAWIVDGVIIYATGQSGGEWVASAFDWIANWPHTMEIHYRVHNPHSVWFGVDLRSCIIYPCGTILCP